MARNASARSESESRSARLWAPWRSAYLAASRRGPAGCIFCFKQLSARGRARRLVLYQGALAVVMLNAYPYNNGHLLIAPRRHRASLEMLTRSERAALSEFTAEAVARLRRALRPDGFNVGTNLGRSAGAGFAGHLHWHVVPRWEGDSNFMPVLSATRVLSQHLIDSFRKLQPHFQELDTALS